ncbi:hypothetical protein CXG81DRAFT_24081 [Caulochytrium protostelioides]|uniref:Uncharacterized protein n=1 Tax=Caulochytrium protostelioides TaxID=1555241 RepID=A0A4P9XCW3_9FUNG|nr:hypothetical protein CXG81DRAFT_24081 [Caulochytrium protostelioides]|eukprot:RKP03306.1 hypothetical protein CXG81DRAFT_24081 [Caulochytrium protostelioides]
MPLYQRKPPPPAISPSLAATLTSITRPPDTRDMTRGVLIRAHLAPEATTTTGLQPYRLDMLEALTHAMQHFPAAAAAAATATATAAAGAHVDPMESPPASPAFLPFAGTSHGVAGGGGGATMARRPSALVSRRGSMFQAATLAGMAAATTPAVPMAMAPASSSTAVLHVGSAAPVSGHGVPGRSRIRYRNKKAICDQEVQTNAEELIGLGEIQAFCGIFRQEAAMELAVLAAQNNDELHHERKARLESIGRHIDVLEDRNRDEETELRAQLAQRADMDLAELNAVCHRILVLAERKEDAIDEQLARTHQATMRRINHEMSDIASQVQSLSLLASQLSTMVPKSFVLSHPVAQTLVPAHQVVHDGLRALEEQKRTLRDLLTRKLALETKLRAMTAALPAIKPLARRHAAGDALAVPRFSRAGPRTLSSHGVAVPFHPGLSRPSTHPLASSATPRDSVARPPGGSDGGVGGGGHGASSQPPVAQRRPSVEPWPSTVAHDPSGPEVPSIRVDDGTMASGLGAAPETASPLDRASSAPGRHGPHSLSSATVAATATAQGAAAQGAAAPGPAAAATSGVTAAMLPEGGTKALARDTPADAAAGAGTGTSTNAVMTAAELKAMFDAQLGALRADHDARMAAQRTARSFVVQRWVAQFTTLKRFESDPARVRQVLRRQQQLAKLVAQQPRVRPPAGAGARAGLDAAYLPKPFQHRLIKPLDAKDGHSRTTSPRLLAADRVVAVTASAYGASRPATASPTASRPATASLTASLATSPTASPTASRPATATPLGTSRWTIDG